MSARVRFALVPTDSLHVHERVDQTKVDELVEEIRSTGRVREPILVAKGSNVILNGHHRFAALRTIGAARVPAWVVEYHGGPVQIDRWQPGPPVSKSQVIDRALRGSPFPPKTTRHTLTVSLPSRPTALEDLGIDGGRVPAPIRSPVSRRRHALRAEMPAESMQ